MQSANNYSLYIHIPFCAVRCTYCAFNVYTNLDNLIPAYIDALRSELFELGERWGAAGQGAALHTLYLGGGTPSLLNGGQVAALVGAVRAAMPTTPDLEITLEANPTAIRDDYLYALRQAGVNRLSIGMQSSQPGELALMRRDHTPDAPATLIQAARRAGFTNISLDLIFGLPGQSMAAWEHTVRAAIALGPDHLSMYSLELEPGTAMTVNINRGKWAAPDDDLAAEMYEWADLFAHEAGYGQYEISNWAKPGHECRHNLQYWRYGPYIGLGAGAHGFVPGSAYGVSGPGRAGMRYENERHPRKYIALAAQAGARPAARPFPLTATAHEPQYITQREAMAEYLFTGLRLVHEGVSAAAFRARFGVALEWAYGEQIARLVGQGLLVEVGDSLRLSPQARMISTRVSQEFV